MKQKSRPQFAGVPYSLHDAHINRIVVEESGDDLFVTVTFYFNEGG